jgi:hypothetical protein
LTKMMIYMKYARALVKRMTDNTILTENEI